VAAHVDAAQNHMKSNYMRNPPAAEIFNEEVANFLKRKIKSSVSRLDDLTMAFDYDGEVVAGRGMITTSAPSSASGSRGRGTGTEPGARPGPAAFRGKPREGLLWLRAGLLPAEPLANRGRRHEPHQSLDRVVADARGDLLLPEQPPRSTPGAGQPPQETLLERPDAAGELS
jgi:hypothetical protein